MSTAERRPRPNPFAFVSDTTFRFALLVAGILGGIPPIWQRLWLEIGRERALAIVAYCEAAFPDRGLSVAPAREYADYRSAWVAYNEYFDARVEATECLAPVFGVPLGIAALLGLVAVTLLAVTLYRISPWWIGRRRRVQPLPMEDLPAVRQELRQLQSAAEVGSVDWYIDPNSRHVGALAFGAAGKRCVLLERGLVKQADADAATFRAVLRHELAHHRNKDVGKTYLTVAMWYSFLVVGVLPLVVLQVIHAARGDAFGYWGENWRIAALALVVVLVRNSILRSRESYADVRAATWEGDDGGLERVLSSDTGERKRHRFPLPLPLRRHPSAESRQRALSDPRALLALGFWEALAIGLVASAGFDALRDTAAHFGFSATDATAGVVYGPLVAGFVGLAVWRAAYADHIAGRGGALRPGRIGVGLGLGLAVGPFLMLSNSNGGEFATAFGDPATAWTVASGSAIVVLGTWALVRWLSVASTAWMPAVVRATSPTPSAIGAFAAFSVVSGIALAVVVDMRDQTILHSGPGVPNTAFNAVARPLAEIEGESLWITAMAVSLVALLWIYPLWGAGRSAAGPVAGWATLNGGRAVADDRPAPPISAGRPIRIGLATSVVSFGAVFTYRAYALTVSADDGVPLLAWIDSLLAVAVVVQVAAGVIAAVAVRRHRVLSAVGSAWVAGVVATCCLTLNLAVEVVHQGQVDWTNLRWGELLAFAGDVMRPGAVATVLVALLLSATITAVHRLRRGLGRQRLARTMA